MKLQKNDYNLNISRYVSTSIADAEIDLQKVNDELVNIEKTITDSRNKHNAFLEELGLPKI